MSSSSSGAADVVGGSVPAPSEATDATEAQPDGYDVVAVEDSPFSPVHADEDEEDDDEDPISDFEIVGLLGSTNGRSCNLHDACGSQVHVGDVVRLKRTLVNVADGSEEAICCVLVRGGRETCTVAFIPRALHSFKPILDHINSHAQVIEMYVTSHNTQKRRKNHQNMGMAGCVFIDTIPQVE
jgi:hypothetical protein